VTGSIVGVQGSSGRGLRCLLELADIAGALIEQSHCLSWTQHMKKFNGIQRHTTGQHELRPRTKRSGGTMISNSGSVPVAVRHLVILQQIFAANFAVEY
jgi:hypothetical protein